jgi:hypothetical protein
MPRKTRITLLSLLLAISPIFLFARDVEVLAEDADLGIPLEGALIRSWDGGERFCDENGRVILAVPDDRPVTIQIAYPGYENRRITIPLGETLITVQLRLGGVMENRELVLEVQRPETSETRNGRSVTISDQELTRTAEIGIIEDVMTSIKLLPGVGYTGMFNAMPSIRGGDPGDLTATLDGFYLSSPYHWGGGFSIFDPKMVSSATLSHGVFSVRHGHTISGLLEVSSKKPHPTEMEIEVGVSTSTTSLNLSYPFAGKGGIMVMGRLTYYEPFIWAAQSLSTVIDNENLDAVNAIKTPPYIRSTALSANYRFTTDLEWTAGAFFGSDGIGVDYYTAYDEERLKGFYDINFDYYNYQGFLINGITYNPLPTMVLKASAGAGFLQIDAAGTIRDEITARYSDDFKKRYTAHLNGKETYTTPDTRTNLDASDITANVQGRADLDWDLGKGFLAAVGVQELYSRYRRRETADLWMQQSLENLSKLPPQFGGIGTLPSGIPASDENGLTGAAIIYPILYSVDVTNHILNSSAYILGEYTSPHQRFGTELGLRMDHQYFIGRDFSIQSYPVLNPRLNLDFNILKDRGAVDSLNVTAGSGLFSSVNETISYIQASDGVSDFELKPNRSWTSVAGAKLDLARGYSFNIEGYYKYVFDRAYLKTQTGPLASQTDYLFDGEGRIWGFDLLLQKMESRYWSGWISYTFTHARYHDPHGAGLSTSNIEDIWYYPYFHRFHNLNLILNIRPVRRINIFTRFGFASGRIKPKVLSDIYYYPVEEVTKDENGNIVPVQGGEVIQRYRRDSVYDENERTTWSLPLDIKISFYIFDAKGRVQTEIYAAVENLLSPVYHSKGNTTYNTYTGEENTGSTSASYEIPIPVPSFGIKWSF